jgi:VCBS repeat protein
MPSMASWLGIEPANYEALPEGRILQEAKLYPNAPMLSEKEWFAIWDYYKAEAPERQSMPTRPQVEMGLKHFRTRKVNFHGGAPMISLVKIDPARKQLYVGDAFANVFAAIDPSGKVLGKERLPSPLIHLEMIETGFLMTLIGRFFPSDATEGAALATPPGTTLLTDLRRPTDVRAADLNGDKRDDLVVCEFGNRLGRFAWHENLGDGKYRMHELLDRPGAIRSEVRDMNGDGKLDIVVMTAQAREGIYLYYNEGGGRFRVETILEQHPSFGYADFQLVDWDKDGDLDLLSANGDNGDYPTAHKPYHGIRLYLNDGKNVFKEVYFFPMEGAYKALPADFDLDGDLDLAAISFYPDFGNSLSFVLLENRGTLQFQPSTLQEANAGRWMVMDAGDLDADGDNDIVLGSFVMGPTTIPVPSTLRERWKNEGAAVLILENTLR